MPSASDDTRTGGSSMLNEALGKFAKRCGYLPERGTTPWFIVALCLVPAAVYYASLIWRTDDNLGPYHGLSLFHPVFHGLAFNSMLLHLLHGSFDLDPKTIGLEGQLRDGLTYTYFGIAPALMRLPFLLMPNFATTDCTRLSCLVATSIMGAFNLASVLSVWRAVGRPERWPLLAIFAFALLFGGAQVQFLVPSIWQEVTLWAAALAAAFVYLVVRGYFSGRGFTAGLVAALAAVAGLCLLIRVSTALGLYAALGLLMLQRLWQEFRTAGPGRWRIAMLAPFLPAGAILCAFIAIAAIVNYGRWGNPLAFTGGENLMGTPEKIARLTAYGPFNIVRLGYALAYYFVPVWAIPTAGGNLLWETFRQRTIDGVELPPSSFFISDPLIIGLMIFALVQLVRHREVLDRAIAVPVLAGLFVPIALILTFIDMTFRYRLEFYPFFDLCAFLGFGLLVSRPKTPPVVACGAAAIVGLAASSALWLLYAMGRYGGASDRLGGMDVISFYRSFFH